jgi:hypothetical protein
MNRYNPFHNRQTESGAGLFGGEVSGENLVQFIFRYSMAGILK